MASPARRALLYTVVVIAVWVVGLPAALIMDEAGSAAPPWRWWGIGAGAVPLLAGAVISYRAGRHLAAAGSGLFGVRPPGRLVIDGPYGTVRNPQDVGSTLMALGPPLAVDLPILWMVPLVGLVYFALGVEPLEDRHMLEAFEDEFREYRSRVSRWIPIR